MRNRPPVTHLLIITFALAALAAGAWFYTNASDAVEGIPDMASGTFSVDEAPADAASCQKAGGVWNECASACPPGAEACILMCVPKCEGLGERERVVDIYFPNSKLDPKHLDCTKVFPVRRAISDSPPSPGWPEGAILQAVLAGPTDEERAEGYFTAVPEDVTLHRYWNYGKGKNFEIGLSREAGKVAGSCSVLTIRSEFEATLRAALPDVGNVKFLLEDGQEETLQP